MIKLPGYTEAEKRVIATGHLLTLALALAHHGLTAEQVHIPDEAIEAVIIGYTRKAGIWDLAGALAALCGKVVRRQRVSWPLPGIRLTSTNSTWPSPTVVRHRPNGDPWPPGAAGDLRAGHVGDGLRRDLDPASRPPPPYRVPG